MKFNCLEYHFHFRRPLLLHIVVLPYEEIIETVHGYLPQCSEIRVWSTSSWLLKPKKKYPDWKFLEAFRMLTYSCSPVWVIEQKLGIICIIINYYAVPSLASYIPRPSHVFQRCTCAWDGLSMSEATLDNNIIVNNTPYACSIL